VTPPHMDNMKVKLLNSLLWALKQIVQTNLLCLVSCDSGDVRSKHIKAAVWIAHSLKWLAMRWVTRVLLLAVV